MAVLAIENVTKHYGSMAALQGVSLRIEPGTVRALVGENGAGKSTLVRVVCGMVAQGSGSITVDGVSLPPGAARSAARLGIGVVHQHFMLIDPMTVAENVVLGAEPRSGPFGWRLDRAAARSRVRTLAEKYGLALDPDERVEALSVGERQRVELLKVLHRGAKYLLLDEPTAVLSPTEIRSLLDVLRTLVAGGAGVVFVSHKLDEVFSIADQITVLRRGSVTLDELRSRTTPTEVARAVVGSDVPSLEKREQNGKSEKVVLELREVSTRGLDGVSLRVGKGEVVGVAGVEGNGQLPLMQVVAGITTIHAGDVVLLGKSIRDMGVAERRAAGLGFVPEDREKTGLMPELSIGENLLLGDPSVASSGVRLLRRGTSATAHRWIARFGIRPADPNAQVGALSGGNAQKVLLARELSRSLEVLAVAQPTRGVDLGAAAEIHQALFAARESGVAILLVSSDLDELRLLADRIIVMRSGLVVGELPASDATDDRLGALMLGAAAGGKEVA